MEFLKVRGSQVGPKTAHTAEEHSALHAPEVFKSLPRQSL